MADRKDIWFAIVNPHAGSGKTMPAWQKAEIKLRQRKVHYTSAKTEHKRHAIEIVLRAAAKGYRKFVAVGGDGTAHEVFNGMMQYIENSGIPASEFTLAVIPIGSGNDWIKAHDVPHDVEKVVELLAENSVHQQDIVKVTQLNPEDLEGEPLRHDFMLNIAGVGFDARVCERVNVKKEMGKTGKLLYVKGLINVLMHMYSYPAKIIADGELAYEGECYSIAFGTGRYSGGGMVQVPLAKIDDGLLDMLVYPNFPVAKLLPELTKLFKGTINENPDFVYRQAKEILVLPTSEMVEPVELDGEVVGNFPIKLEVLPQQMNVLYCPEKKEE